MGCDIHLHVEQLDEDTQTWFMTKNSIKGAEDRQYNLFAALAGVRGEGPEAKGIPDNLSLGVRYEYELWESDAHSASYYDLDEFMDIYMNERYNKEYIADLRMRLNNLTNFEQENLNDYNKKTEDYIEFALDWDADYEAYFRNDRQYRVVFWFDN